MLKGNAQNTILNKISVFNVNDDGTKVSSFNTAANTAAGESLSILYDQHENYQKAYPNKVNRISHIIGGSEKALKLFNLLAKPPSDPFCLSMLVLALIESALTKIVVVDERVAEAMLRRLGNGTYQMEETGTQCLANFQDKLKIHIPFQISQNAIKKSVSKILDTIEKLADPLVLNLPWSSNNEVISIS